MKPYWIFLGMAFCAVAIGSLTGCPTRSDVSSSTSPIDFTMNDPYGEPVQLSHFRGKVVVVDIWATWCGYCVNEIPDLIAAQRQARNNGTPLQFIGVAMDNNSDDVHRFVAKTRFNYPILFRDNDQLQPFGAISGYPTKFIIDKKGYIVDKIVGAVPMDVINQHVAKYLK